MIYFFVMAHQNVRQALNLCSYLKRSGNDVMLHLDERVPFRKRAYAWVYVASRGINWCTPRPVFWAGWSQVQLQLDAIMQALKLQNNWTHFCALSGQCCPIKPIDDLNLFLSQGREKSFMQIESVKEHAEELGWRNPITLEYDWAFRVEHAFDETGRIGTKVYNRENSPTFEKSKPRVHWINQHSVYGGSNWTAISRNHCEFLSKSKDVIQLGKDLRFALHPDEIFFQTALGNSEFADSIVNQCLWEIDWSRGSPYEWQFGDFGQLLSSDAYFARKFSPDSSKAWLGQLMDDKR